jgi:UDP-glucose 4-epimerase
VARANILAAEAEASDVALNVGSGVETSLAELAACLGKVMGRPDLRSLFGPERKVNSVTRRLADTAEAARRLGFRASIGLEEGLRELVGWWRSERGRFATAPSLAQTA